jgi:hypothetical protein
MALHFFSGKWPSHTLAARGGGERTRLAQILTHSLCMFAAEETVTDAVRSRGQMRDRLSGQLKAYSRARTIEEGLHFYEEVLCLRHPR